MRQLLIIMLAGLLAACGQNESATDDSASPRISGELQSRMDLDKMIISTPPAVISSAAVIDIEFTGPVVPSHFEGQILDRNPFSFDPGIKGHARWVTESLIRFVPEQHLPAGQSYRAVLKGKTAFGEQKNVNDFSFSFKVAEQEVLQLTGDFEADPDKKQTVRYHGVLLFAQPVDKDRISGDLRIQGPGGKIRCDVTAGDTPTEIRVVTEPISRSGKPKNYRISLPAKYRAEGGVWQRDLLLPAMGTFRIIAHMDMTEPGDENMSYGFRFSDPLKKNTDLSGYVSIEPAMEFDTRVQDKYLIVRGGFLPGQAYIITITPGVPSVFGGTLDEKYIASFSFTNIDPEIQWLSEGIYLPDANDFKLQFKSVNIRKIRVRVTEIFPQNIGFFVQNNVLKDLTRQDGRMYSSFEYSDLHRVGEQIHDKWIDIAGENNQWIRTELNLDPVFRERINSIFVVQLSFDMDCLTGRPVSDRNDLKEGDLYFEGDNYYTNPARHGYYYSRGTISKLLIASDIGLTMKTAEDGLHVFASHVQTARPVSGLTLGLYSYQNRLMQTRTTDSDGHALFHERGAYLFGETGYGIALMKTTHETWQINHFDVSGGSGGREGTNVFMYTDRGVHRPGDTVHLSAFIRLDNDAPPEKQPVILKVQNPRGQTVLNSKKPCGANGHVYFPVQTNLKDPTGDWRAEMQVGGQIFYKTLKIETVKPNRLRIDVDLPENIEDPRPVISGEVQCKYLFGAPAAGLRTVVRADISGAPFRAGKYTDYIFNSPLKEYQERSVSIFEGALNDDGACSFRYAIPDAGKIPALLRAGINTTVYEKGGSFTENLSSVRITPYPSFAGIRDIFKDGYTQINQRVDIPLIAVSPEGNPVPGHPLKIRHYVNREHWWYDYDRHDRRDFREMTSTYFIDENTCTSAENPVLHRLEIEDYGQHFLEVTDMISGHQTGLFFYASRWGRPAAAETGDRNTLPISSNQNIYNVGDRARLVIETPDQGMALLTLEQGNQIIHREWKPVKAGETGFAFDITREMMPNVYASVSLIQPHNQNTNDLPMRLYGLKTLYVEDRETRLPLTMTAPDVLKPREKFTVSVHSSASRTATYTIAVVDEGLLDLTGFRTPDPWNHFYQKIRLAVQTMDNFDDIFGVLYPDIDRFFSIGGGLLMAEASREKRVEPGETRRFKPVVLFHEPVEIKPGKTVRTEFVMPNYVGAVRVMVVGAAGRSYVSREKSIPVKQSLMVLPTVPRVIRPGDVFEVPVTVFALDSTVRNTRVALDVSSSLTAEDPAVRTVQFAKPGEKDIRFPVKAGADVGEASVTVEARSGDETSDYQVDLPVLSANPFYTEVTDTFITKGQSVTFVPEKFGIEGTNAARLAFTRIPDIQLEKRYKFLIRYPYGCIEQTVSSVFPQLYLDALVDLEAHEKEAVTDHINAAMQRLVQYQISKGFSYWPVSSDHSGNYSDWGTSYAGHFMIEAKALGYHVPPSLFDHWLSDASERAKSVNKEDHRYQTYRLFLLALAGKPHIGAMNVLRENYLNDLDPLSQKLLAAAYFISGQKSAAQEIDRNVRTEITGYREMGGTFGSHRRDLAFMICLCLRMEDMQTATRLLRSLSREFVPHTWYSTQETAMALLSLGTFYKNNPFSGGSVQFHVHTEGRGTEKMMLHGYQTTMDLDDIWGKRVTVTTDNNNPLFISLFVEGIPLGSRIRSESSGLVLRRNFYDEDGHPVTIDTREQGKPFWVIYNIGSQYGETIENVALSSVFPAGWEIINTRLTGEPLPGWVEDHQLNRADYMDIRDDRVNWFLDLRNGSQRNFGVKINPSFKGTFALPPVVAEAMYSPDVYARIKGGTVLVE